jgi:hypothetical protein
MELTLAIIASVTSLVVAITSLFTALLSSRQSARSAQMLEKLRNDIAHKRLTDDMRDARLNDNLKALRANIEAIQQVKDEIQLVLSAVESSLDTQSAIGYVRTAREALFDRYEASLADLSDAEAKACHRAKNVSLAVENTLLSGLHECANASGLSDPCRQRLLELRAQLTDVQHILRDIRSDKLAKRLSNA